MHTLLIVEDDPKIAEHLHSYISKYGYEGHVVTDIALVKESFRLVSSNIVLLFINFPRCDRYYWCLLIRQESTCPVIFISARTGGMDQVMALENGGDDFITKPFHSEVVMAKIRSQLRRDYGDYATRSVERIVEQHDLQLFPERHELKLGTAITTLTSKETDIIERLLDRYPRVAGREDLLEKLWDDQVYIDANTLNVNMTRVRKKLLELGIEDAVETVRGSGYRLRITWGKENES